MSTEPRKSRMVHADQKGSEKKACRRKTIARSINSHLSILKLLNGLQKLGA
jgi:hypothetical protein